VENVMTAEGLKALQDELEQLETVARRDIAQQIKTAREWGDLKENAEYHEAKKAQAFLETRILQIRERVDNATIVEKQEGGDIVAFGATVEVEDEGSGRRSKYTMVSAAEANPTEGRLSFDSPVATALRDHRVGEVATVQTPSGERRLRVVSIS
jgi:transcription elongation factor GreA